MNPTIFRLSKPSFGRLHGLSRHLGARIVLASSLALHSGLAVLHAENVTLTTYYPAPAGLYQNSVYVAATVSSANQIQSVQASIAGRATNLVYTDSAYTNCSLGTCAPQPGWSAALDLDGLPPGSNLVTIVATDVSGNIGQAQTPIFIVNTTPFVLGGITVQGRLKTVSDGTPVTGAVQLQMSLYDRPAGGSAFGQVIITNQQVTEGLFTAIFSQTNLDGLFDGGSRYLGLTVNGSDEMTPRLPVQAVPYALRAQDSSSLDRQPASSYLRLDLTSPQTVSGPLVLGAVGAPPFNVLAGSTGLVANLNAQYLAGQPAAAFAQVSAANQFTASQTFTAPVETWEDLSLVGPAPRTRRAMLQWYNDLFSVKTTNSAANPGASLLLQAGDATAIDADGGNLILRPGLGLGAGSNGTVQVQGTLSASNGAVISSSAYSNALILSFPITSLTAGASPGSDAIEEIRIQVEDPVFGTNRHGSRLRFRAGAGTGTHADGGNVVVQGGAGVGTGLPGQFVVQQAGASAAPSPIFSVQNIDGTADYLNVDSSGLVSWTGPAAGDISGNAATATTAGNALALGGQSSDSYGKVQVSNFWFKAQTFDDGCWCRVFQPGGGGRWGWTFTPRIGQEVLVDFLNGDPDRPIIVQRTFNDNPGPYHAPSMRLQAADGSNGDGGSIFLQPGSGSGGGQNGSVNIIGGAAVTGGLSVSASLSVAGTATAGAQIINGGSLLLEHASLIANGPVSLGATPNDVVRINGTLQPPLLFGPAPSLNTTALQVAPPTGPNTITIPDASGTLLVAKAGTESVSAAPSVKGLTILSLDSYTSATQITDLSDGIDGQVVVIVAGTNNTAPVTIQDGTSAPAGNFRLQSSQDWPALPNRTLTLCRVNGVWFETCRASD